MLRGVALAFLTYGLFASADAMVKSLGGRLPVMEIVFFATLFSFIMIMVLRPRNERWRHMFRMNNPRLVWLRAACGITAGILGTFAFTTIPLAEVYALAFLSPVLVTLLSIPFLGERVGWRRLSAVGLGFAGMLLVVQPGFRELHPGHLAAFLVAFVGATSMIILRKIGQTERRVTLVGVVMVSALVVSGVLMVPVFVMPDLDSLLRLGFIGVVGGTGQMTLIAATRAAPANRVAPTQYSQILWAVVFGALFFVEFPNLLALVGIGLIAFSGIFTFLREDKVTNWPRRTYVLRNRL